MQATIISVGDELIRGETIDTNNALKLLNLEGEVQERSRSLVFPLPEAALRETVERTLRKFPGVKIGSYPKWEEKYLTTEIRFRSKNPKELEQAVACFQEEINHKSSK